MKTYFFILAKTGQEHPVPKMGIAELHAFSSKSRVGMREIPFDNN